LHRLKIIYKKVKKTFKVSKNVWWWSVILKFTYKLKIMVEHEIIVEWSGTPLECPWSRLFERLGCSGCHHLKTIRFVWS